MKLLLTSFVLFCGLALYSQTWQNIGTTIGTNAIHQDLAIDPITGDLYVAYVESATQRANVRKWNGTAWVTVGNTNFGQGVSMVDIKIATQDGAIYVVPKFLLGGNYYVRGYYLNGSTWSTLGSVNYQTPLSYSYSIKVSSNDSPYLSFFNQTASVGSTDLITLGLSTTSQGQIGGVVSDSYAGDHDFVIDDNEDIWVAHEYGDMSNYVNVSINDFPDYLVQNVAVNDWSGKIVMNLADGSVDARIGSYVDDATLGLVRYNLTNGVSTTIITMYNSTISDYDMASTSTHDYFFYSIGSTHYIEGINMANTQNAMGTNVFSGSGSLLDPRIEVWNGRIVISCIRGGLVRVMEIDNPATVTLGNTFAGCETVLTTAPTVSLIVNDNNYSHANLSVSMASTDALTVPNTNVVVVGSYPNYYLRFTSNAVASNVNVEFEFETIENGVFTNYDLFYADVINAPDVTITAPSNQICKNHGLLNLSSIGNPSGGIWTGPGVVTGKFNPLLVSTGAQTLTYTYSNSFGCSSSANYVINVNPVPVVTVATTSATCGQNNGAADATITGGTPAYTIYWSNGSSTEDITGVAAGMYYINVTDTKGCVSTKAATVPTTGVSLSATATGVICAGGNTGAIDLTATATSGIQSIQWSNGATTEDLSGLQAGFYEVTVTANDGCVSTASYEVTSPDPLTFSASTVDASCATNDGSATCLISGGTGPYTINWFSAISGSPIGTGATTLSNVPGGGYFAIITDASGCSAIHNTMINETGGPLVTINDILSAGCANDGAINVSINSGSPVATIEWSSGQTTEDITGLSPGFYTIEVTDALGCVGMGGVEVPAASPDINPICLVTVDTLTNTNLLVWEKPVTTDISHFNIYRETSVAGVFQFVDSVLYADESIYNDLVASPQVRSWRYKLTAVNLCDEESDFSEFHKTIHLTIGLGLGSIINLNWDAYEGFGVTSYDLYRYTNSTGWQLIQAMPSNLFSYADTPPNTVGLDYIISVAPPATCTSTNKAQDHNSSRSNKTASIIANLGLSDNVENDFTSVYPNPSTGQFTILVNPTVATNFDYVVVDVQGRVVLEGSSNQASTTIELSNVSDGVYNLQLLVNENVINKKLIKQ